MQISSWRGSFFPRFNTFNICHNIYCRCNHVTAATPAAFERDEGKTCLIEVWTTAKKMKFSINDFFSKCDETADLVKFTEEIFNGKLHFLCSATYDPL